MMKNFVAKMQSINLLKDSLNNPFFLFAYPVMNKCSFD